MAHFFIHAERLQLKSVVSLYNRLGKRCDIWIYLDNGIKYDDLTINWIKSYLQGREQCVIFKGNLSKTKTVTHGVPQGSILGPLLFNTFVNDLPIYIDSPLDMYADDSTIHVTGKTIEEWKANLIFTLKMYKSGAPKNRMTVNAEKTKPERN